MCMNVFRRNKKLSVDYYLGKRWYSEKEWNRFRIVHRRTIIVMTIGVIIAYVAGLMEVWKWVL